MGAFFPMFPIDSFTFDGKTFSLEDLTRFVAFEPRSFSNGVWLEDRILNCERPDVLSVVLYSSPDWWWTFFVVNGITFSEWPMEDDELESVARQLYTPKQLSENFRWTIDGREVPQVGWKSFQSGGKTIRHHFGAGEDYQLSNPPLGVTKTRGEPSILLEVLEERNQARRKIKVIKKQHLVDFESDFRRRLHEAVPA